MSQIKLNLITTDGALSGEIHGSVGDAMIAALTAEPETLGEMEVAVSRFIKDIGFSFLKSHEDFEPFDAGLLIVDLSRKAVMCDSTYSLPSAEGEICYHDGKAAANTPIRYKLSKDWRFFHSVEEYRSFVSHFQPVKCTDYRKILYGRELSEFLAADFHDHLITETHVRWMMTARDDLDGKRPREAFWEKHDFVEADLFSRELQWSFTGICPPCLPVESGAFRLAGFGTHEIVVYYYLVRYLLENFTADIDELERLKTVWLETPREGFLHRTPAEIIELERKRMPLEMTMPERMIDDDCDFCRMMQAEFETPMFWHLDGCQMDEEFAFSFDETEAEFEAGSFG